MANLGNLIVRGVTRILGDAYANKFIGNLQGNADTATSAIKASTADSATSATSANKASIATAVQDYGTSSYKEIKIGYSGSGLSSSTIETAVGFTDSGTKIKDISKDEFRNWLATASGTWPITVSNSSNSANADTVDGYHVSGNYNLLYKNVTNLTCILSSITTDYWYVKILIRSSYQSIVNQKMYLIASYSNLMTKAELQVYGYYLGYKYTASSYNADTITGIASTRQGASQVIWLRMKKPIQYEGATPNGNISIYSNYIASAEVITSAPSGVIFTDTLQSDGQHILSGDIKAASFKKNDSSDGYVLLGGGGHKAISEFKIGDYLPLTGGTVTGPIEISTGALHGYYREGLRITCAKNNWAGITFGSTGLSGAPINGWFAALNPSDQFIISPNDSSTTGLTLNAGGDVKWRNNTIWHAGNDGTGSGLDADLLDGVHANGLFTNFSNKTVSGNKVLAATIGGKELTVAVEYAGSAGSANILNLSASIGTDSDTHATALQNYFNANKSSIQKNKLNTYYSYAYGNGSFYMGYFLSGYNSNPYGGFFVAHYDTPYYVGISYGTYNEQTILTSSNYTTYTVKKDGTGASGTWGIDITGNAATATNADTLDGYHATSGSNTPWGTIPAITNGGYMDVGKHFEFHYDNTTGSDYSTVLKCTGNYNNIVDLPSASGTLALLTDNVASSSKWANARTITLTGSVTGSVSIDGSQNVSLATTTNHTHTFDSLTSKPTTISGYGIVDSISLMNDSSGLYVGARSNYGENMTGSKYLEWWNSAGWVHHKAGKFSVPGGTSSQFLKADGSLDSTAYLTEQNLQGYATQEWVRGEEYLYRSGGTMDARAEIGITTKLFIGNSTSPDTCYTKFNCILHGGGDESNPNWVIHDNGYSEFKSSVSANAFYASSDIRLKNILDDINIDFDKLKLIPKKYYTWKGSDILQLGTIAQDIQKIYPEVVSKNENGYLSVDYSKLSIIALAAIDKLNERIKELECQIKL